jgi:hypothetical protein
MYEIMLARWKAGKLTEAQVDLLVKTGWLTPEQGKTIKDTDRGTK